MAGDTTTRRNGGVRLDAATILRVASVIVAGLVAGGGAWAAMSARIATTDTRLGHVEAAVDRLGDVRETVAEIRAEQRAQRTALDRIDRTVQRMAQPK